MREPVDFELPSGEGNVQLRPLSGFEVMLARKKHPDDDIDRNLFILSLGLGISEGAARTWAESTLAGDFKAVMDRIEILSGLREDAEKAAYKSLREGPE